MSTSTPLMTAEQLFELPSNGLRRELVQGEVVMMNPSGSEHGAAVVNLTWRLAQHVSQEGLGTVFGAETGFLLRRDPDTVRAPDVAFVRRDRILAIGIPQFFFPGAPDLAVEVVSPNDRPHDVEAKAVDWVAHGAEVWVVDPRGRTVVVYASAVEPRRLGEMDILETPNLLPGFRLPVVDIFPRG